VSNASQNKTDKTNSSELPSAVTKGNKNFHEATAESLPGNASQKIQCVQVGCKMPNCLQKLHKLIKPVELAYAPS